VNNLSFGDSFTIQKIDSLQNQTPFLVKIPIPTISSVVQTCCLTKHKGLENKGKFKDLLSKRNKESAEENGKNKSKEKGAEEV